MGKIKLVLYIVFGLAVFTGCNRNKWDININDVKITQNYIRFDKLLFNTKVDDYADSILSWQNRLGRFLPIYSSAVINIGRPGQFDYTEKLHYFVTDPYIEESYKQAQKVFNPNQVFAAINDAFKHYHYYFPGKVIPDIYTHISGFNQSIIVDSAYMSIALDKYLGTTEKLYAMLRTPMYLRKNMFPAKIPTDAFYAWIHTEFPYNDSVDNVVNQMIYYGQLHVLMDACFTNTPDTVKWGYSHKQMQWLQKNEAQMWLYMVEHKLLFDSSQKNIRQFIDAGPYTKSFGPNSPGSSGQWLGYRIVSSFLNKHSHVSLNKLMQITNYQYILNESGYKP